MIRDVPIEYQQGGKKTCLFAGAASGIAFLGYHDLAKEINERGLEMEGVNGDDQMLVLKGLLDKFPAFSEIMVFDNKKPSGGRKRRILDLLRLEEHNKVHPHIAVIMGEDGYMGHALCVTQDKIFDGNSPFALKLCKESLDWCSNCKGGFRKVWYGLRCCVKKEGRKKKGRKRRKTGKK